MVFFFAKESTQEERNKARYAQKRIEEIDKIIQKSESDSTMYWKKEDLEIIGAFAFANGFYLQKDKEGEFWHYKGRKHRFKTHGNKDTTRNVEM